MSGLGYERAPMIGLVIVSHSYALGRAVADLASEMVPAEARPALRVAAGLDETTFGTDASAIADAITAVDGDDGVLVLTDLGSAVLSAEMALEFIDPVTAGRTTISAAPLVEGLVAALVTASTGAPLAEVDREATQGLMAKQEQLGQPEEQPSAPGPDRADDSVDGEEALTFSWTIRNPHGLHARPAASLVTGLREIGAEISVTNATTGRGPVPATSLTAIQALGLRQGDLMAVTITGTEAERALERLTSLAESDFGEKDQPVAPSTGRATAEPDRLPGPPVLSPSAEQGPANQPSAGPDRTGRQIVIGGAHRLLLTPDTSGYVPADPAGESARFDQAVATVEEALDRLSQGATDDIYAVQKLTLEDEDLRHQIHQAIGRGRTAVDAVQTQFDDLAAQLEAIEDPYLRARAEDQRGLQRLLLRALTGQELTPTGTGGILIVDELDPLTAGSINPQTCQGIITLHGGATGHGAIVAQARGFALATGHLAAAGVADGTIVAIDPVDNRLWIDPDQAELSDLRLRQKQRQEQASQAGRHAQEPALTRSGRRILVEANIGSLDDAVTAQQAGAEGSGLVRTEVLFGDWDQAPTAEEQAEVFSRIGQALSGRLITVRTWDPGGDKPLRFLPQEPEKNPMLGERGIRAMRRLPELLDDQLTAVLLANRLTPVRVMFPMIATVESMAWARGRLAAIQERVGGRIEVGMMVETPAAALRARDFLDLADFISVGTNDLTQYTLAVDRGNPQVADIASIDNSAVFDLIGCAARAFTGRPVAVCGDFASHPELVSRLIGLGVTELSVRSPLIGVIKEAVRASD